MAASRPTFARVFTDPKQGLRRSAQALATARGSRKDAREFLKSTSMAQAQKAWRRLPASAYSMTGGPSGEYQADTIYLSEFESANRKRMAILTLIEATTRYVYARALMSSEAEAVAVALRSIMDENGSDGAPIIRSLVIDGGPEFKGVARAHIDRYHIKVNQAAARTHQRLARVDRYHRTLREQIGRLMESRGNHQWADALPDLVSGYNSAEHRTLGMSPVEMNAAPRAAYQLRKVDRKQARSVRKAVTKRAVRDDLRAGILGARRTESLQRVLQGQRCHLVRACEVGGAHWQQRVAD